MRLPKFPARTPKGSATGGLKAPAFVNDLYRDMRDRRLLVPAAVLLIAILALPVLLSSEPEPVVPPAPAPLDPDAAALEPGVLAVQEVGVRDFRERLDALKRKNPFGDRFEPDPQAAADRGDLIAPVASGSSTTGVSPAPSAGVDAAVTSPPETSRPPDTTDPPEGPKDPETFILVPRINVKVGVVGRDRREKIKSVNAGDLLPGNEVPTAMFLGNDNDSEYAELLVSRDVTRVAGDGQCKPRNSDCEFLRLADGERAALLYEPNGKRYSIRVTKIYFVRIDEDRFKPKD